LRGGRSGQEEEEEEEEDVIDLAEDEEDRRARQEMKKAQKDSDAFSIEVGRAHQGRPAPGGGAPGKSAAVLLHTRAPALYAPVSTHMLLLQGCVLSCAPCSRTFIVGVHSSPTDWRVVRRRSRRC
jgi:hypothetical protein